MNQQSTPPNHNFGLNALNKLLLTIIKKLSDEILLFILAVFAFALITYLIGGLELIIQLKIIFLILALVGVISVVFSRFFISTNPLSKVGDRSMTHNSNESIQLLTKWVDNLTRVEFERMIHGLLTKSEETRLTKPVNIIDSSTFLNDMRFFRMDLDEIRSYLEANHSDRRP